ncbi:MFS transporter [Glutamicibacter sp. MNS18]|uniref:MFS transporter n=1 Tax=Glutamicibacter sp. MNS18 TaxID=2989817 RepID=UPI00223595D0|nr:MFS transporter [Glutamicibacter sp. MNS18]MCW4466793.1 MFS transporter [Glutamicibacter sp. MNS18]
MSRLSNQRTNVGGEPAMTYKRRFLIRLTAVLIGGMFLDGYILGIIGTVIGVISIELQFSALWEGLIVASVLAGILIGSPIGGWLSDRFGRKPLFMIDMLIFVVASAMQFFIHEPWQLFVVRLLMGVAIGIEYSVGWPLMSEFAPARMRGRLLGLTLIAFYAGFMAAFVIGYLLTTFTTVDWRVILGSSTIIALSLFVARFGLPESPHWLWSKKRYAEARETADKYLEEEFVWDAPADPSAHPTGRFSMLFSRKYWRATLFCSVFWLCAVTPYFAIATFADSVLAMFGLNEGLLGGIAMSGLAVLGVGFTVLLIDRRGRRSLTVPPQWVCFVLLLGLGLWVGAPMWFVLGCLLAFSFLNAGYTTLTGVYPGEVFPTEIRGLGTGFATAVSRVGAGFGTFVLPSLINNFGVERTMLMAAGVVLIGALISQWLAPETKGKSLTETSAGYVH